MSTLPIPGLFAGFAPLTVQTARVQFAGVTGGAGFPVLLLHGYPETHAAWHLLAPGLARHYAVVAPDVPGYGRSQLLEPGAWSKRDSAAELVLLMRALGHEHFFVVGHDRGVRVGYRLALDYPACVRGYCALAAVPILDIWPAVDREFAKANFHWFLFLQANDLVEKLLANDPDSFLDATLTQMAGALTNFHPAALADYRQAFRRPSVRAAMIQDYQAAYGADTADDAADRAAGRRLACPVFVVWAQERLVAAGMHSGELTAVEVWRRWAEEVSGITVPSGHLIPEFAAPEVLAALLPFFSQADSRAANHPA